MVVKGVFNSRQIVLPLAEPEVLDHSKAEPPLGSMGWLDVRPTLLKKFSMPAKRLALDGVFPLHFFAHRRPG